MKLPRHFSLLLAALFFTSVPLVFGEVTLPAIISDHMVLARSAKVPLWGKAAPGEEVTVTLNGQSVKATADASGKWSTSLNLKDSPPGPFELSVEGKNKLVLADVLVGEVWVASGQSNMEFGLKNELFASDAIAGATNETGIRLFMVPKNTAAQPQSEIKTPGPGSLDGAWQISSPATLTNSNWGWNVSYGFSAIGYYFAHAIHEKTGKPVGMIGTYWGGTSSETWTSAEALDSIPELKATRALFTTLLRDAPEYSAKKKAFVEGLSAWIKENGRADNPVTDPAILASLAGTNASAASAEGWTPVKLPGVVTAPGLPQAGAVWLRKEITIPGKTLLPLPLTLPIEGYDSVYWNGKLLKQTTYQEYPGTGYIRHYGPYDIPAAAVNEGKNTLAIRLYEPVVPAKFFGEPKAGANSLSGEWLAKAEYAFPELDPQKIAAAPLAPRNPIPPQGAASYLFNAMIHPLMPYAISGVIWYQGEGNANRAYQYRTAFPLLITDWRKQWNQGDFPFYFCQLANFMPKKAVPAESAWAELREAQSSALTLPNTGEAVLIDLGESADIHPRNKRDVGDRLAVIALAKSYGKAIPWSGPVFDALKVENGRAILNFTQTDGGLVAKPLPESYTVKSLANQVAPLVRNSPNSQLEGFAICGEDKKWVWADAKIEGDKVTVWSEKVPSPVAVRYAWADNPTCNLYNGAGLPASPFRTDNFTPSTFNNKY